MAYPLNIYITAHTLISSLGFGIPENLEAIHNYRSGIRMQAAGLISDHPLLAGMIDSVELEKRAKLMQITDYTRMEQLFILAIQEVISQSGADLREPDCALLLSTTKGNIDLLSDRTKQSALPQQISADSPVSVSYTHLIHGYGANLLEPEVPFPTGFDAIWMSQFLDCFSEEEVTSILTRAARSMSRESRLYIMETFWNRQKFDTAAYCLTQISLYFTAMANGNSKMSVSYTHL